MKVLGKVWKEYLASWPEGQWYDYHDVLVDGQSEDNDYESIKDDAVVTFATGVVYLSDKYEDHEGVPLVRHFNKWKRSLSTETHLITIPKNKLDEFREFAKLCDVKFVW